MRPAGIALALAFLGLMATEASAHRLKLFAAAAGQTVSGYGFFVGGGRAAGTPISARDGAGLEIWRGATNDDGTFAFDVARPGAVTLVLDAGDGHAAETTLLAGGADAVPAAAPVSAPAAATAAPTAAALDAATLAPLIAAEVDRAVARHIRPLLEANAATEARIRLNDVLGGLGWITGLAGTALFFRGRKRR